LFSQGIAVGVSLGVILILLATAFFILYMKRRRRIRLERMKSAWANRMSMRNKAHSDPDADPYSDKRGGAGRGKTEFIPLE
jgi:Flp pilus assembly protein TadB